MKEGKKKGDEATEAEEGSKAKKEGKKETEKEGKKGNTI